MRNPLTLKSINSSKIEQSGHSNAPANRIFLPSDSLKHSKINCLEFQLIFLRSCLLEVLIRRKVSR